MKLNTASFPTFGPMPGDEVEPWHYSFEADQLRDRALNWRRQGYPGRAMSVHATTKRLERVARMHSWHPQALRSMAFRERCHESTDATYGQSAA